MEMTPESQLYLFEILANYHDPKNEHRQRLKTTPFKVLQAIFLITRTNENKGRENHYPSKELIAKVAEVSRKEVTEFVTSNDITLFCSVQRRYDIVKKRFESNVYVLHQWVYDWMRLFWRSGMMRNFKTKYLWWLSDFRKRIKNWLIPLVQKGLSVKEIYERFVNKLSIEKCLKGAAGKPLKGADIKPTGSHKVYETKTIREESVLDLPCMRDYASVATTLKNSFYLRDGDVNSVMKSFRLSDLKRGVKIHWERVKSGFKPDTPVAAFISSLKTVKNCFKQKGLENG